MKVILSMLLVMSILGCSQKDSAYNTDGVVDYKRNLALQKYDACYNIIASSGFQAWGRAINVEMEAVKSVIDSMFLAIENPEKFAVLSNDLLPVITKVTIEKELSRLIQPNRDLLSLAELIIYIKYQDHIRKKFYNFDLLKLITVPTDSGITISVAGGLEAILPGVVVNDGEWQRFDDPLYKTLPYDLFTEATNELKVSIPTAQGDTTFYTTIEKSSLPE